MILSGVLSLTTTSPPQDFSHSSTSLRCEMGQAISCIGRCCCCFGWLWFYKFILPSHQHDILGGWLQQRRDRRRAPRASRCPRERGGTARCLLHATSRRHAAGSGGDCPPGPPACARARHNGGRSVQRRRDAKCNAPRPAGVPLMIVAVGSAVDC